MGEDAGRATRYLEAGVAVGRWLAGAAIDAPDGDIWPVVPGSDESFSATLFGSGSGVALFLSDLYNTTGEEGFADLARDAARFVARCGDSGQFGLYSGYAGMTLAVCQCAGILGDDELAKDGIAMVDRLVAAATPAGDGIEWPAWPNGRGPWSDLYHGTAGIALVLDRLGRSEAARAAGRRLVELALPAKTGRWWRSRPDDHKPAPNIAHGTAGVAYCLATLALSAGDDGFEEAALDGARYLTSIARTDGGTCAVHHHEGDGTELYTMGFCSGPPGLACLFIRLYQVSGDEGWLGWARATARTITTSGLPAQLYPGFWDNVGQCCGSAGVADFLLGLYGITGAPDYLDHAAVILDDVIDRASTDSSGMRWRNVEHTVEPPELPAQTGWMRGAAGIGASLLRGHRALSGGVLGPWLPSWPYPDGPAIQSAGLLPAG
jgi:lantibiotic modifying enzyme